MIKAVIFDMDGLLINSEPFWQEAEIAAFSQVGIPITKEKTKQTMGLRIDEVVEHWYSRYPWNAQSKEDTAQKVVAKVIALVQQKGKPKQGVYKTIKVFTDQGIPTAIASSSSKKVIDAVIERLGIAEQISVIHSAESEARGKPHPDVYLSTAKKLGIPASHCLAFEDSPNGVLSAKAAGIKCIAVPDETIAGDPRFKNADIVLNSLEEFNQDLLAQLQSD